MYVILRFHRACIRRVPAATWPPELFTAKNCSGMAQETWQIAHGIDLASKFPRSQFDWASLWRTRTSPQQGLHELDLALTLQGIGTWPLGVSWGVWHQGVSCGSFESCGWAVRWGLHCSGMFHGSIWDLGNLKARLIPWVCHVTWAILEQSWAGVHQYSIEVPSRDHEYL